MVMVTQLYDNTTEKPLDFMLSHLYLNILSRPKMRA